MVSLVILGNRNNAVGSQPQPDRLVKIGNRAVEVALFHQHVAAIVMDVGIAGIKPDRLVEIGDSAVDVALGLVGKAPFVEDQAIRGLSLIASL